MNEEMVMNDKLNQTAPATNTTGTPKSGDGTPDPGDCCVAPPGGSGDPGPGGPTG
jgi:hypothetical protein